MYDDKEGTWEDVDGKSVGENDRKSSLDDYFLIGMTSYHKDFYEDRTFRFFYAYSPNYALSNCVWTDFSTYNLEIEFPEDALSDIWGKKNFYPYVRELPIFYFLLI